MLKNFSTKMASKSIHLCCSVLIVCNHLIVKLRLQNTYYYLFNLFNFESNSLSDTCRVDIGTLSTVAIF